MNIADMDLVKFKEVVTLAATERGCELVELMLNDDDNVFEVVIDRKDGNCLLYTSPSPRDDTLSRMPSSA